MSISDFFAAGGVFMTPITLIGIGAILLMIKGSIDLFVNKETGPRRRIVVSGVLQLGLLAFFVGVLSQAIGLIQAFQAIEAAGDISPALVAGGLKVSLIAPVYGLIIMIVSFVSWMVLKYRSDTLNDTSAEA